MTSLKVEQYQKVFKLGEGEYDVAIHKMYYSKDTNVGDHYLPKAIQAISLDKLKDFFEYHYNHSTYKTITLYFIDLALRERQRVDMERQDIGYKWIAEKTKFDQFFKKKADAFFIQEKFTSEIDKIEWKQKLKTFLLSRDSDDIIAFLNYGKTMLNEGYALHKETCERPNDCFINDTFDEKLDFCQKLIEDVKRQIVKHEEEISKSNSLQNNKRIQWLGTQKQLGELLIELQRKGWIEDVEYDTIKNTFTNSNTIQQVMKPSMDKKTKQNEYDQIYTAQYTPSFSHITENKKKSK